MTIYTTRDEAIEREIIAALEAGDITDSVHLDYDVEMIADELIQSDEHGFWIEDDPETFWGVVQSWARDDEQMMSEIVEHPQIVEPTLPVGIVLALNGPIARAIAPVAYRDDIGTVRFLHADWDTSEHGIQTSRGRRIYSRTLGEATSPIELIELIARLEHDGRTAADYLRAQVQEIADELVREDPGWAWDSVGSWNDDFNDAFLNLEDRVVEVFWVGLHVLGDGMPSEVQAIRELTDEEFEAYVAELAED